MDSPYQSEHQHTYVGMLDVISQVVNQNRQIRTIKVRDCEPCMGGDPVHGGALSAQSVQPAADHLGPGVTGRDPAVQLQHRAQWQQPGTGWLYDSSSIALLYSSEKNLKVSSRGSSCLNT